MARRKKTYHDPGQRSLLDYITGAKGAPQAGPEQPPAESGAMIGENSDPAAPEPEWKGPYGWIQGEVPADPDARFAANLDALRVIRALDRGGMAPASADLDILSAYSGFGGIPLTQERESALRSVCPPAELAEIRRSSQGLPPLSAEVRKALWSCLGKAGVRPGSLALIPFCQSGSFAAQEAIPGLSLCMLGQGRAGFRAASLLYPKARVINKEFGSLRALSVFDAAIGALPLSRTAMFDLMNPEYSRFPCHTHHLLKSLSSLRKGGIAALAAPRWFMDGRDDLAREARKMAAAQADLLGALRIPAGGIADEDMIPVDLLVFRKTDSPEAEPVWLEIRRAWSEAPINALFDDNPDFMAGRMIRKEAWKNGTRKTAVLIRADAGEIRAKLAAFSERIPEGSFIPSDREAPPIFGTAPDSDYFRSLPQESLFVRDGAIMVKNFSWLGEEGCVKADVPEKDAERTKSLIALRDALNSLLAAEECDDPRMDALRDGLNARYDSHVAKFGFVNQPANMAAFRGDPSAARIAALEVAENGSFGKTPVFTRRSVRAAAACSPRDAEDALAASLRLNGRVDPDFVAKIAPEKNEAIGILSAKGMIFKNPESGEWEDAARYLSGNVREKLALARKAGLPENEAALARVLPRDVGISEIGFGIGAAWIPGDVYIDFVRQLVPGTKVGVRYVPETGDWLIDMEVRNSGAENSVYGTFEFPMSRLFPALIRSRPIIARDGEGRTDAQATLAARQKAEVLKSAFRDWVLGNAAVSERLERIYNETFNTHVPPHYDGSGMIFSGMSRDIELAPHQKDAVCRAVREGRCLFDHAVGTGKTMIAIASIMESRRMGLMRKPVIIAQQSVLGHWMREFERLYPNARVLLADPDSMSPQKRGVTLERIRRGDYDAIVMAHSSFTSLAQPYDFQIRMLKGEEEILKAALREHREAGRIKGDGDGKIGEAIANAQALIADMSERKKAVGEPDFAALGIDAIFVDESHEFKNLHFKSSMSISGLGDQEGSQKAWDLFLKCRYLQLTNGGRGVFLMTGTPISNSIAEIYTIQRYLDYDGLKKKGIAFFDAWAGAFAEISGEWELDATGTGYKFAQRLSKFRNLDELSALYRSLSDVVTGEDLAESELAKRIPLMDGGAPKTIIAPRSPEQAEGMDAIVERMRNMPADASIDNPLKATSDARKLALDQRLSDPDLPDWEKSKANICADNIAEIYRDTPGGLQLVFCDLSTPKGRGGDFSVYDDLKAKLAEMGIPEKEIAFAHDALNPQARQRLFAKANAGEIRVLIGSTARMGTGVNVQRRAVAAHHLDAPWRQSDLEQRNGRVIRQGNMFHARDPDFRIKVFYYATENTLDARMWQLLEYKSAAVAQFRKGLLSGRELEDTACAAVTAAEMKAAASGNPLVLREIRLKGDIGRLKAIRKGWERDQETLKRSLPHLLKWEDRLNEAEGLYNAAKGLAGEKPSAPSINFKGSVLSGKEMNEHVKACAKSCIASQDDADIGIYRGLFITCFPTRTAHFGLRIEAGDAGCYHPRNCEFDMRDESLSVSGIFRRIDNFIDGGMAAELEKARERAGDEKLELAGIQAKIGASFPHEAELAEKEGEYAKVLGELSGEKGADPRETM